MILSTSLRLDVSGDDVVVIVLEGTLDETAALAERGPVPQSRPVILQLARLLRVNSLGTRDFVRWVEKLESAGDTLYLVDCSPAVVAQVNQVVGFCGKRGRVVSFLAPYYCPGCREAQVRRLRPSQARTAPPPRCDRCGTALEFDDFPQSFFAFVDDHRDLPTDAKVREALDRLTAVEPAGG